MHDERMFDFTQYPPFGARVFDLLLFLDVGFTQRLHRIEFSRIFLLHERDFSIRPFANHFQQFKIIQRRLGCVIESRVVFRGGRIIG